MGQFPSRLLAPIALGAALLAVLLVVVTSTGGDDGGAAEPAAQQSGTTSTQERARTEPRTTGTTKTTPPSTTSTTETTETTETTPRTDAETYTVRPGDTPGSISEKTGVPVEEILELNPDIEPNALTVGQEIRLSEE